jgi:polar amino acid transport system substrate-binding protein
VHRGHCSDDRATRVAFSAPYLDIQLALVARPDGGIHTIDDLRSRPVGVRVATTAAEYVWRHTQVRRITLYDMNSDVYAAVASREVDAAVDDSPIASWFARNVQDVAVVALLPATHAQYALMFAQSNVGLRKAVDGALSRVQQDGRYATMHARWIGDGL